MIRRGGRDDLEIRFGRKVWGTLAVQTRRRIARRAIAGAKARIAAGNRAGIEERVAARGAVVRGGRVKLKGWRKRRDV